MQNWGEGPKVFETKRHCVKTEGCGGSGTLYEQLNLKKRFKNKGIELLHYSSIEMCQKSLAKVLKLSEISVV